MIQRLPLHNEEAMKHLTSFIKLIRWPNLLFIVLTQVLFYYIVIPYCYRISGVDTALANLTDGVFVVLVLASVVIAAAGYIINDYYDIPIDQINKPDRVLASKGMSARSAMVVYILLSVTGVFLSSFAGLALRNLYLPVINSGVVVALLFYSALLKKKMLIGNLIVSLMTAWVILVLTVSEHSLNTGVNNAWPALLKISWVYAGFAFVTSLIREVIKDIEDREGDKKLKCTTLPIVWGVKGAKIFTFAWIVILLGGIVVVCMYLFSSEKWLLAVYGILFLVLPLLWLAKKLFDADSVTEFHRLSNLMKAIMLIGILSMVFFKFY